MDFVATGFVPISLQNIKTSLKEVLNVMPNNPLLAAIAGRRATPEAL
jgi:predicted Co/Zn/Cd cation transporter (cation efflux family)